MVLDAHVLLNECECIPQDGDHSDFRSSHHRTGTLECMIAGTQQRTQLFNYSTGDELTPAIAARALDAHQVRQAADRYGIGQEGSLDEWQASDPARLAEKILYRAKRILCKDKCHQRMMFIRDGRGHWHNTALFAADAVEKHLLMRLAAEFVERKGCDAIIEVSEVWYTLAGHDRSSGSPNERTEALFVMVITREGFFRTYVTPFTRGPFGGIKLRATEVLDREKLFYLAPIIEVWRKQGYDRLPGGQTVHRLWVPDPLDVCFCGGPKRFASCCKQSIGEHSRLQVAIDSAIAESCFGKAEKYARAAVAQYVIWVKQHTVPMMNVADKPHKDFVDMDILALEANLHQLERVQDANGTSSLLVEQLRHLAGAIGVPRISARLIALASQKLWRLERTEEAVLELDRLRDLNEVDDALALMIAAKVLDLDAQSIERALRRAVSSALSRGKVGNPARTR